MANLPSKHPHLSLHLTDRALTPLITSASQSPSFPPPSPSSSPPPPSRLEALTSLSHAALSAHESASRLGLGLPLRVMVEHADAGPVLLQSFLRADTSPLSTASTMASASNTATGAPTAAELDPEHQRRNQHGYPNGDAGAGPSTSAVEHRLQQLQLSPSDAVDGTPESALEDGTASASASASANANANAPPMLISVVVAPSADEARDARRAAARLERVGRAIQAQWAEGQDEGGAGAGAGE
ncbi:hypothetical protein F4811DRAFT_339393 [Daldinia bambusicola]|nr:hypothetical protein F4811DRAFT_339393 [Daldinia bambusicola]